ncbi:short chain dehydrogenase [compost metagenome]
MSDEMKSIYGARIDSLRSSVKETVKEAIPVEIVAQAMVKAVVGDHPRLNYLLGRRIRLHAALGKYLPARVVDRMMMSGLGIERN